MPLFSRTYIGLGDRKDLRDSSSQMRARKEEKQKEGVEEKKCHWLKKMSRPFKNWVLDDLGLWRQSRTHSSPASWACQSVFCRIISQGGHIARLFHMDKAMCVQSHALSSHVRCYLVHHCRLLIAQGACESLSQERLFLSSLLGGIKLFQLPNSDIGPACLQGLTTTSPPTCRSMVILKHEPFGTRKGGIYLTQ